MNEIPERPLSDEARARRKAELMHAIEKNKGARRWLVPAVAAAAVIGVVSVGAAVAISGDGDPTDPVAPAGSDDSRSSAPQSPKKDRTPPPTDPDATTIAPVDSRECADLDPRIKDAEEIHAIEVGETTVRIYANARKYVTCDEWAHRDGGDATLFAARAVDAPITKDRFRISMNFGPASDENEYVAGGLVPDGVQKISYRFSGRPPVDAVIENGVWAMAYFPDKDLTDRATAQVTVTTESGTEEFILRMGPEDFCAQVNHGC